MLHTLSNVSKSLHSTITDVPTEHLIPRPTNGGQTAPSRSATPAVCRQTPGLLEVQINDAHERNGADYRNTDKLALLRVAILALAFFVSSFHIDR